METKTHKLPMAEVQIRSPRFNHDGEITVRAAVCDMPAGIRCYIGNPFSSLHPQLSDIVTVCERRGNANAMTDDVIHPCDGGLELDGIIELETEHQSTQDEAPVDGSSSVDSNEFIGSQTVVAPTSDTDKQISSTADEEGGETAAMNDTEIETHELNFVTTRSATTAVDTAGQITDGESDKKLVSNDTPTTQTTANHSNLERNETLAQFGSIDISAINNNCQADLNLSKDSDNDFYRAQRDDLTLQSWWTRA